MFIWFAPIGLVDYRREEFERLSALLRSRVINSGVERKKQASQGDRETRPSHQENQPAAAVQTDAQRWRQDLQKSREERENGVRTLTVYEIGAPASATPIAAAEVSIIDYLCIFCHGNLPMWIQPKFSFF